MQALLAHINPLPNIEKVRSYTGSGIAMTVEVITKNGRGFRIYADKNNTGNQDFAIHEYINTKTQDCKLQKTKKNFYNTGNPYMFVYVHLNTTEASVFLKEITRLMTKDESVFSIKSKKAKEEPEQPEPTVTAKEPEIKPETQSKTKTKALESKPVKSAQKAPTPKRAAPTATKKADAITKRKVTNNKRESVKRTVKTPAVKKPEPKPKSVAKPKAKPAATKTKAKPKTKPKKAQATKQLSIFDMDITTKKTK